MPNPLRIDPTRTGAIRRAFMADVGKRFRSLKGKINALVIDEDAFGIGAPRIRKASSIVSLNEEGGGVAVLDPPVTNDRFAFDSDASKVAGFQQWFQDQVNQGILDVGPNGNPDAPWTNTYVDSAYRKGMVSAYASGRPGLANVGGPFAAGSQAEFLLSAFAAPEAISKIQLIYTRAYDNLTGITQDMGRRMSDVLATGLARGDNPRKIARDLNRTIEGITRRRALTLARTEVIHAHAEGQLDSFERLGIDEVGVMAEWVTAGDDRVCPLCGALSNMVFTVAEARGMLPRHPNCRCAWVPANVGEKKLVPTKAKVESQMAKSIKAEGGRRRSQEEARANSRWVGADRTIGSRAGVRAIQRKRLSPKTPERVGAPSAELWDHQPTAVLRWMGSQGWDFKDARKVMDARGVKVSDATIRAQLRGGKTGTRGAVAGLSDEQAKVLNGLRLVDRIEPVPPPPPPPPPPPVAPSFTGTKGTPLARWLGANDFSFDEAKVILKELGIDIKDNTLRIQLRAGKTGARGAPAKLSEAQATYLRGKKGKGPAPSQPGLKPVPKPDPKPVTPPTPKPPEGFAGKPAHITYSGETVSPTAREAWALINKIGDIDRATPDELKAIGKLIRESVDKRPEIVAKLRAVKELEDELAALKAKGAHKWPVPDGVTPQEARRYNKARQELHKGRRDLQTTRSKAMREEMAGIRDFGESHITYRPRGSGGKELVPTMKQAETGLPDDWTRAIADKHDIEVSKVSRGYYSGNEIAISGTGRSASATATHELVHAAEDAVGTKIGGFGNTSRSRLGSAARDFRAERAAKAKRAKDREITTIYKGTDERGYKDDFSEHYMGKVYGGTQHTEIHTMGIEGFMHGKYDVMLDDDYLDFILGSMSAL